MLQQELSSLLHKGVIEEVPPAEVERGFFSHYFLVPKKDGDLCLILDRRTAELLPLLREMLMLKAIM